MVSPQVARHVPVTRRIEEVSGIRPVTLLVASGIVLITAILLVTGIAATRLRQQALATADAELARIAAVLAASSNRSLSAVNGQLAVVADNLKRYAIVGESDFRAAAEAPETRKLLRSRLDRFPQIGAVGLVAANGDVLGRTGAWPTDEGAVRDIAAALTADAKRTSTVGAAWREPSTGAVGILVGLRVEGATGTPLGAVVGILPVGYLTSLFAVVPLPADATITLHRQDGSILARYPATPEAGLQGNVALTDVAAVLSNSSAWIIRHVPMRDGKRQIEAWRALEDYPAALSVSRSADQVLAEWAAQGLWFVGFALLISIVIAIVVYLIARQLHTQEALAEMRTNRIEAEKIEMERARLAAEAEVLKSERLAVLGQLTATVGHELRNPLSAIRNTLFTIKELTANTGIKLARPVARIERSIERCDRIISDLLEYTKNREMKRTLVPFDSWLADMLAELPVKPPAMLRAELAAGGSSVMIDADRVRRVIINLVENAAQALDETAPDRDRRIVVRTSTGDGAVAVVVEDTGPGIAQENLSRIFEPLFSTKSFGTGLGLPTVKQIVNQHGGSIAVDSEPGHGTRVTVCLPLPADATQDATQDLRVAA